MLKLRRANERGKASFGWLDGRHSFSFGHYYDPGHMGFRSLRVMNDDRIAPKGGFPAHAHENMEILTYVIEGTLAHRDSMGNGSELQAGMFQRMTAGTGVEHSEFNAGDTPLHLYQIWILPERDGLEPGYEELQPEKSAIRNRLYAVAGPKNSGAAMRLHQDATVYLAHLEAGEAVAHALESGRYAWVQVVSGNAKVNGETLETGDGAALSAVDSVAIEAASEAGVLLFDLA